MRLGPVRSADRLELCPRWDVPASCRGCLFLAHTSPPFVLSLSKVAKVFYTFPSRQVYSLNVIFSVPLLALRGFRAKLPPRMLDLGIYLSNSGYLRSFHA